MKITTGSVTSASVPAPTRQTSVKGFFPSDKVTVTMTRETFIESLVEMVVHNGIPFRFFSEPACKKNMGEMARKLNVSLDREQVKQYVMDAADRLKTEMKKDFQKKFVYLKFDCATRIRTNYLGVNIRYVDSSNNPVTKTLSVCDTKSQHSSRELKSLLNKVLEDFNIPLSQVLCCVTDNASNMIKIVKDFNQDLSSAAAAQDEDSSSDEDNDEDDHNEEAERALDNSVKMSLPVTISHVRCAMHTLQLAILDGLDSQHAKGLIGKIRAVATEARTPKVSEYMKKEMKLTAFLDQDTRWGSTYMMVDRILQLKPAIVELAGFGNRDLELSNIQWQQAQELRDMLELSFKVTKKMQLEDLTTGYFFRKWTALVLQMENNGGLIAQTICDSMRRREKELLNNTMVLSGVYMDVFNMHLLTTEQKQKAREAVVQLALRLKGLSEDQGDTEEAEMVSSSSAGESDSDEEIQKLRKLSREKNRSQSAFDDSDFEMEATTPSRDESLTSPTPILSKRRKEASARDIYREKFLNELDLLEKQRMDLKKKKKSLQEVIISDYPGKHLCELLSY